MTGERRLFHENSFGNAWQCNCAEAVHLQFGNIALLLSHPQLSDFATYISETLTLESGVEDKDSRCIYLPTRDLALMFVLSYSELQLLDEILSQTTLSLEIDKMLNN